MNNTLIHIIVNIPAIICFAIAYLRYEDRRQGWGWFVALGILLTWIPLRLAS